MVALDSNKFKLIHSLLNLFIYKICIFLNTSHSKKRIWCLKIHWNFIIVVICWVGSQFHQFLAKAPVPTENQLQKTHWGGQVPV